MATQETIKYFFLAVKGQNFAVENLHLSLTGPRSAFLPLEIIRVSTTSTEEPAQTLRINLHESCGLRSLPA